MRILDDAEFGELRALHPEIGPECPTCKGAGHYNNGQVCRCSEQRWLRTAYSHAGVGMLYQRLTWADVEKVPELISDWLDNADAHIDRGVGLFLSGPSGTGKTLIANLIIKDLVKREYDCYATTFAQTIEMYTDGWHDQADKTKFARRFMCSRVLLLDDLGKEMRGKLSPTTLDYILRTRVQEARPTIVTSNLSPTQILNVYGTAAFSLLAEQSIHVNLDRSDFRPQAHERSISEIRTGTVRPIV